MIHLCKPSLFSGESSCMSFDIEPQVFDESFSKWEKGELIQNAFPMLNADEREFLMTGMTAYETLLWNQEMVQPLQ